MSRTPTDICNMAADFLDGSPIGNIASGFGEAPIYSRNYAEAVETVIAEYSWNMATTRIKLTPLTLPEVYELNTDIQTGYAWPSDCIKPISINGRPCEDINWSNESVAIVDAFGAVQSRIPVLFCDAGGDIVLRYAAMIDPSDMSAHLAKACALELAIRCHGKIKNSTQSLEQVRDMYAETCQGSTKRRGGYQVDTRSNRNLPPKNLPSTGARARAGGL